MSYYDPAAVIIDAVYDGTVDALLLSREDIAAAADRVIEVRDDRILADFGDTYAFTAGADGIWTHDDLATEDRLADLRSGGPRVLYDSPSEDADALVFLAGQGIDALVEALNLIPAYGDLPGQPGLDVQNEVIERSCADVSDPHGELDLDYTVTYAGSRYELEYLACRGYVWTEVAS